MENPAVRTRKEAMSISGTWKPAEIPFEIVVNMHTCVISRTSSTSALMNVELGGSRSVLVKVHNVPEELLDRATQDSRVERPVVIGAFNAEDGAVSTLSRVRIGDVEYHLTS
ncbi:hypothetical protein A2707_01445 [Candidatus Saccharibacteria bacterium RIFCSPHIGHO2_01_FULL_45_15]|nr:MAG: hypothetical protein A2707_01445 [Candidatus Saccharibacteria bacterium RIFCSPHIGHO2_01_FULL_45_15]OGL32865.1 MAG: hypothetical protein A3E76_05875 [Candidatus Saccharibacteria bacterium RIFCSPHIGHO2_12_FULL_44_22]